MSENTVSGAGTTPGGAPNSAPTTPVAPQPTPQAPPAGTEGADDVRAQEDLFNLVNDQGTGGDNGGEDLAAQLAHWKEMARKNEARAKANADKAGQFDAYQESQKTELQKANDRAERAEAEAAASRVERLQLTAAASYEIPSDLVSLLGGGTEAEINARAESISKAINERAAALASRNGNGPPQRQPGGRPVESMRPGAAPATNSATPKDPNDVFRNLLGRNN